jgi:NAD(P)-dependent dehydrogenase (short-subunit alcohol dehydrogenase family)
VTGAGSGIGAGTARRFLQEGAFVVLNGRREEKLHETIAGFDAAQSLIHPGDVSDEEYVKRLVEDTIAKFGKLDVLVNNAGIATFGPFTQTTTEQWRKLMGTDLDAVYFATREALPHLLKTKGSIVNLSSVSGLGGDWGSVPTTRQRVPSRTSRAPWPWSTARVAYGSTPWHRASPPARPLQILRKATQSWRRLLIVSLSVEPLHRMKSQA